MSLTPLLLVLALFATGPTPGPASTPDALVGSWTTAAATGSQYCDAGACASAYGGSETWTFTPDAHWEYSQYLDSTLYDCSQTTFLDATGTLAVSDVTLTLTAERASNLRSDTCGETSYEELDLLPMVYQWQIRPADDGHPQLYLTNEAGDSGPFDPRPAEDPSPAPAS